MGQLRVDDLTVPWHHCTFKAQKIMQRYNERLPTRGSMYEKVKKNTTAPHGWVVHQEKNVSTDALTPA